MFEKALQARMREIFDVRKVTFDDPGDSNEQECLFLQVEVSKNSIKDGRALAQVRGKAILIASSEKVPFGYLSKCIAKEADKAKDLFFYDIDENTRLYRNLVQRAFSFVYFFDSQYDPEIGTITTYEQR